MTSRHEMHDYAQQGDADDWNDLPAEGEGWNKPQTVDPQGMGREELERQYKMRCNELIDATQERMELIARVEELTRALVRHGTHNSSCNAFPATSARQIIEQCDCGLMATLHVPSGKRITQEAE